MKSLTPESRLKADVLAYLKATGLWFFRMQSGKVRVRGGWMMLHDEGTSDFLVFPTGRTTWIELKAEGCTTKKERVAKQAEFRDKVMAAGHEYAMCWSIDDVAKAVKGQKEVGDGG